MSILHAILDVIYPPKCSVCTTLLWEKVDPHDPVERFFCRSCFEQFSNITPPFCIHCGRPFPSRTVEDHTCEDCLINPPLFDALRAPYLYEGPLMEAIHQFKYGGKRFLAKPFGTLLADYAQEWIPRDEGLLVMPVPVHPIKLKEREFNQSLLLARPISTRLEGELDFLSLRRIRNTLPQTGLKGAERRRNVRRAFAFEGKSSVKGRTVLVIDDVATTGNTLNECARVLKTGGAREILCLVLARTAKF